MDGQSTDCVSEADPGREIVPPGWDRPSDYEDEDMPRRISTAFFLGDVAFLSDPKFRALARRLPASDDFNSAVGAYWIALAAARRNGTPTLDAAAETDSRFLGDLEAVGLLLPTGFKTLPFEAWAPTSPQSAAGKARAESAGRDAKGLFTKSSEPSALDTLDKLVQPSPPLPSSSPSSPVEGESLREGDSDDPLDVYWNLTGNFPSGNAARWLTEMSNEFGPLVTGNALALEWSSGPRDHILNRVKSRLMADRHKAEQREHESEAVRLEAKRKPDPLLAELKAAYRERYGPEEFGGPNIVKDMPA
jgi:hypothetical protein